jgi:hypothetical protein
LASCFIRTGLVSTGKNRLECTAHDQLSETFADWIAVQITSEALLDFATEFHIYQVINAARNSVRDLCLQEGDKNDLSIGNYPSPKLRINKIFGSHPAILKLLGCQPKEAFPSYCPFSGS